MKGNETVYILDDRCEVSEEVKNMTHEERLKEIRKLEEQGRKEGENIPYPKL